MKSALLSETGAPGCQRPNRPGGPVAPGLNAREARLPYLPGLDGLRALAVIAVLLYHAEVPWMPGGFLGVEVFFVLSGYLITALLLAEWRQHARIDLCAFWLRRARRLLPALYVLFGGTLAFSVLVLPDEVARLRSDAFAAFAYVTNWYLVFHRQSYFVAIGRPSLLQHLWSLAIEEQFYLLWPPLLALMLRRWRPRAVLLALLAGAAAASGSMALLYQPDADPSRLYYGTDTRAAGLLIGAALAVVWAPWQGRERRGCAAPLLLDAAGLGALGALGWCAFALDEFQPFLYRGGFAAVALLTAVVIAVAAHPRTRPGRWLGGRPLRWIGLRSYSLYLWHWPVFMVTRPQLDLPLDGMPLLLLRLAVTAGLAELSLRYVETPIRNGAVERIWRAVCEARGGQRWRLAARWGGTAGAGIAAAVALGVAVVEARPPTAPDDIAIEAVHLAAVASPPVLPEVTASIPTAGGGGTAAATPLPTTGPGPTLIPTDRPTPPAEPPDVSLTSPPLTPAIEPTPAPTPTSTPAPPRRVTAIGDSVMIGAARELQRAIGNVEIDAAVARQIKAVIAILRDRRAAGTLGDVVIVHIGNNGPISAKQFDEMMSVLADVRRVIIVNAKVPRRWEAPNNAVLAEGVKRYPQAVLVDWHAASADRPELFGRDGIHLRASGARVYADLIATYLLGP